MHEDVLKREALDYFQECLVGCQEAEESYALHITFLQYMSHITNPQRQRMKAHLPQTIATMRKPKKGIGSANIRDSTTGNTTQCKLASHCQIILPSFSLSLTIPCMTMLQCLNPFQKACLF